MHSKNTALSPFQDRKKKFVDHTERGRPNNIAYRPIIQVFTVGPESRTEAQSPAALDPSPDRTGRLRKLAAWHVHSDFTLPDGNKS